MANNLNQAEINAIENYSDEIKTLKDFVSACRRMPGMYIGGVSNRGYLSLIREIYQNSVDQLVKPGSPATEVYLYYNMQTLQVTVRDNGLGLPYKDMERILTVPNTSKNYEKRVGEYSSGKHGIGCKATNALSSRLIARSYKYDGTAMEFTTTEGYPDKFKNKSNPYPIKNKNKFQGSEITFYPCEILGEINLDWKVVYTQMKRILLRSKLGAILHFEAVDSNGVTHKEDIVNKDGIIGDLIEKSHNPICRPITVSQDNGYMKLEAAFVFDAGGKDGPSSTEEVISFCNMCPTQLGTHEDGVVDGITKWFVKYINNIYLSNSKSKTTVIAADIKTGLIVSINAAMLEPIFVGQAKEQLSNPEMAPFCRDTVMNTLDEWSKANPQDLAKLCKYFKEIAEVRIKSSGEKLKIVTRYQENSLTGYPRKYKKPLKAKRDFMIVEGDRQYCL